MKQHKLWVIRPLYVLFSMFALVFGFSFTQAGAAELTKVRMAQNLSPISGIVIVAKEKGLFEKHGLDVVVSNFTSGKQALDAVIGGGADIATTAESPVTAAAMAKQKIAFITRMEYSDLQTLTAASAKINSLADLKGKRIGYTVGTGSEVYTMLLLKRAGLTKSDVTLVSLRPQDMAAALSSGGIDAMDTWEPHISNAEKALGAKVKELNTKGIYAETFNIVTMQDYLAANPDVMLKFLRSMLDAEKWMKANREEAISIVAKTVGMNRDDLAQIWNKFIYQVALDKRTIDVLRNHAEWRLTSGNAPAGATMPDFSKVIFPGPLKQVAPDRVNLNFNED
jgi:ABC-type nitrate/sulfonate/bicarbonate transport system substrate-binding protein